MKILKLVGALSVLLAMSSAYALNPDGTGGGGAEVSLEKLAFRAVVEDRLSVIEQVLASDAMPTEGSFSDMDETRQYLMQASDDVLAAASLATSSADFTAALMGDDSSVIPRALTAEHSELVYVPIAPCRIFDTRLDSRGAMTFRETRAFAVQGTYISDQGGDVADCPEIPYDPPAVALNLTATNATTNSWASAWEYGGAQPAVSTLNYTTSSAIANSTIVPTCEGCGSWADINVYVRSTAQVVGDVVGYFRRPNCPAGHFQMNGKCFESGLRTATDFYNATVVCESNGGRIASAGELCQAVVDFTLDSLGEHSDSLYFDGTFKNMRIGDQGSLNCFVVNPTNVYTTAAYRCVKPLIDE